MDSKEKCEGFWEGFVGDDLAIPFQLLDSSGAPVKIGAGDGMTDIVGEFTNADGTMYQTKYSVASGVVLVDSTCGRAQLKVPAASSALLAPSTAKQKFTIFLIKSGIKTTWGFSILLKARPVPTLPTY